MTRLTAGAQPPSAASVRRPHIQERSALADADAVHIWRISLQQPGSIVNRLSLWLSSDEKKRAQRLRSLADREKFIIGRGAVRDILGRSLGLDPSEVAFCYGAHGKPDLERNAIDLRFNLSHSHALASLAVGRKRDIGIDIERIRVATDISRIAQRFFSANEYAELQRISLTRRREAFFACWTRKEAFIKARGGTLFQSLKDFDVSCSLDDPATLLALRNSKESPADWTLSTLSVAPEYYATLAVKGGPVRISYFSWTPL